MKKITAFISVLFCLCSIAFALPPEFDKGEAFVFDPLDYPGKAKDNFEFINKSSKTNFGLTLYGYQAKRRNWEVIGTSLLKKTGDSDNVKTTRTAKEFEAFAVKINRNFPVKYIVKKHRDNLVITVVDDVHLDLTDIACLDVNSINGKFKDNFVIRDHGAVEDKEVFWVYGSDEPEGEYELVLITEINRTGDTDKEDFTFTSRKINGYKFLKIAAVSGKNYVFNFSKEKDDLIVDLVLN